FLGMSEYDIYRTTGGIGAHNSFVHMIGYYGLFTGILYMLFWAQLSVKSVYYYLNNFNYDFYASLVFSYTALFISISMMEEITRSTIMCLALFSFGYIRSKKDWAS